MSCNTTKTADTLNNVYAKDYCVLNSKISSPMSTIIDIDTIYRAPDPSLIRSWYEGCRGGRPGMNWERSTYLRWRTK